MSKPADEAAKEAARSVAAYRRQFKSNVTDSKLPPRLKALLQLLCERLNTKHCGGRLAWPSQAYLAEKLGWSPDNVYRWMRFVKLLGCFKIMYLTRDEIIAHCRSEHNYQIDIRSISYRLSVYVPEFSTALWQSSVLEATMQELCDRLPKYLLYTQKRYHCTGAAPVQEPMPIPVQEPMPIPVQEPMPIPVQEPDESEEEESVEPDESGEKLESNQNSRCGNAVRRTALPPHENWADEELESQLRALDSLGVKDAPQGVAASSDPKADLLESSTSQEGGQMDEQAELPVATPPVKPEAAPPVATPPEQPEAVGWSGRLLAKMAKMDEQTKRLKAAKAKAAD